MMMMMMMHIITGVNENILDAVYLLFT